MYKAILVDDEILVREAIAQNIDWEKLGYELVADCENGQVAMDYIKENSVDLVLTDINMPYVDGLALSKYIHENHPKIIVIIFSGYSEFDYAKKAIQYNVAEYLLKPVTPRELIDSLTNIKERLEKQKNDNKKMQRLEEVYTNYTKNESVIIANEFSGLVKGTQDTEICLRNLKKHGIELSGAYFRVAVIDIDIFVNGQVIEMYEKKESALMSFVVENISDEIVREENCGLAYRDKDGRVCVLLFTNKPQEFKARVIKIFERIRENVYSSMVLSLSIGVGKYVETLDNLYESYENALDMMKYQYVKGFGIYFDYEREKKQLEIVVDMDKYLKEISRKLKSDQPSESVAVLRTIEDELGMLYIEKNHAITYLHQIVFALYEYAIEICGEGSTSPAERDIVLTQVTNSISLEVSMNIISSYNQMILNKLAKMKQSSGKKQALAALSYLNDHYGDKNLNLNSICSYLNISTSHFSNIFKEETGETFMESLTRIRMEKAKQLLIDTSLKNYEIADRVGFSDPHYFNIAFKKMTGQTPKAFAKENQ